MNRKNTNQCMPNMGQTKSRSAAINMQIYIYMFIVDLTKKKPSTKYVLSLINNLHRSLKRFSLGMTGLGCLSQKDTDS